MRTSFNIDDDLLYAVRRRAAETNQTMTAFIEDAVRQALLGPRRNEGAYQFDWVTVSGNRLMPGVDISDRDKLYDLMDGLS